MTYLMAVVLVSMFLIVGGLTAFWSCWAALFCAHGVRRLARKLAEPDPEDRNPRVDAPLARTEKPPERRLSAAAA